MYANVAKYEKSVNYFYDAILKYVINQLWKEENKNLFCGKYKKYVMLSIYQDINEYSEDDLSIQRLAKIQDIHKQMRQLLCFQIQEFYEQLRKISSQILEIQPQNQMKIQIIPSENQLNNKQSFRQSQLSKYFSMNKKPIQWKIEANQAEHKFIISQLMNLLKGQEQFRLELQEYALEKEEKNNYTQYSDIRLSQLYQSEKNYTKRQLNYLLENNKPLQKQLKNYEDELNSITENVSTLQIIEYFEIQDRLVYLNSEAKQFLKTIKKEIHEYGDTMVFEFSSQETPDIKSKEACIAQVQQTQQLAQRLKKEGKYAPKKVLSQEDLESEATRETMLPFDGQFSAERVQRCNQKSSKKAQTHEVLNVRRMTKEQMNQKLKSEKGCTECNLF